VVEALKGILRHGLAKQFEIERPNDIELMQLEYVLEFIVLKSRDIDKTPTGLYSYPILDTRYMTIEWTSTGPGSDFFKLSNSFDYLLAYRLGRKIPKILRKYS